MVIRFYQLVLLSAAVVFVSCKSDTGSSQPTHTFYITTNPASGDFTLFDASDSSPICYSSNDYSGVIKILHLFANDLELVGSKKPKLLADTLSGKNIIIVGTLGKNKLIDSLAAQNKIEKSLLENKWEASLIQVVNKPFKGIEKALVIAGSDKRGTIYGMFDVSEKIGVSPWYWWADVPIVKKEKLAVKKGTYTRGEPKVKYRGIFINDEAPALSGWVYEKYGEFNSEFYAQVFELILRLKGNYLWPAMWGRAFSVNDTMNPILANELGIVVGTSHHEPMMRAHAEWSMFGKGDWNYIKNKQVLDAFWKNGIKRMGTNESIVTIGMRGDGDEPMSEENNIALLEQIVANQRQIIEDVTGKSACEQPQIWALYKEVQEYYDKGMRVPDDVTLLLCDDNWGNVRKLPNAEEQKHQGGYGMYYHFDYVGGPRNYKWINTNLIPRIWEQMERSYAYGVNQIWIVNVGDIKPMELPTSFFLDYAWNPENWPLEKLDQYTTQWAAQQFGYEFSKPIANLLDAYTKYNARRKPEMLDPETYSITHFREFESVVSNYRQLVENATELSKILDTVYYDAFYQLVLFPIMASANLNELYYAVAKNRLYAEQGRSQTNKLADSARFFFAKDSLLTLYHNTILANGKWNHMMDQTHIGYTNWQQPDFNSLPEVTTIELETKSHMGMAVEGNSNWWPNNPEPAILPEFTPFGPESYYVEIFNRGSEPFSVKATYNSDFLKLSTNEITITDQHRFELSIDWNKTPKGKNTTSVKFTASTGQVMEVYIKTLNPEITIQTPHIMNNGCVAFEATDYDVKEEKYPIQWKIIPNLGKTGSAITTYPSNQPASSLDNNAPYLEYRFHAFDTGWVNIHVFLSPTLDFLNQGGLRFGLALNNDEYFEINMHTQAITRNWDHWVGNNIIETQSKHYIASAGENTLRFYRIDDGVILQRIIIANKPLPYSYLGAATR